MLNQEKFSELEFKEVISDCEFIQINLSDMHGMKYFTAESFADIKCTSGYRFVFHVNKHIGKIYFHKNYYLSEMQNPWGIISFEEFFNACSDDLREKIIYHLNYFLKYSERKGER